MCGRFKFIESWETLRDLMELVVPPTSNLPPNYNAAPTQDIVVVTAREGHRRLETMRWGLVPIWAKEMPRFATFNAKAEGLEEKATWKGSLRRMRAVVPATSFYEWTGPKGDKQPYEIRRRDGAPLLFAGLWAVNDRIGEEMRSATIITCPPNGPMARLHNRMPVILEPVEIGTWLEADWGEGPRALLRPATDDTLTARPVSREIGSVRNNGPEVAPPVGEPIF